MPVLRFNFPWRRGSARCTHDQGHGEREDTRAALAWLEREYGTAHTSSPVFSFGASVGLHACCADPRVKGIGRAGASRARRGRAYDTLFWPAACRPNYLSAATTMSMDRRRK